MWFCSALLPNQTACGKSWAGSDIFWCSLTINWVHFAHRRRTFYAVCLSSHKHVTKFNTSEGMSTQKDFSPKPQLCTFWASTNMNSVWAPLAHHPTLSSPCGLVCSEISHHAEANQNICGLLTNSLFFLWTSDHVSHLIWRFAMFPCPSRPSHDVFAFHCPFLHQRQQRQGKFYLIFY